jgi:crotonobetainyl-CoA:carnitine CoA-transferase CaiB-like acyl-CoA transferase
MTGVGNSGPAHYGEHGSLAERMEEGALKEALLQGVRVVDGAGEPGQMSGRILADLGAEVVKLEPPGGDPLRRVAPFIGDRDDPEASLRFAAWNAGKTSLLHEASGRDDQLDAFLAAADIVIDTPGWPGAFQLDPDRAPQAVWVRITPFGLTGPRSSWTATDLGAMAASGNMYVTGFPDRAPLRCSEPSSYAHVGPEAAFAAITALASGRPQVVDVSIQEAVIVSNMGAMWEYAREGGDRGSRLGGKLGATTEIWRCRDGWVSFGLRGGVARAPTYWKMTRVLEAEGLSTPAWSERDWDVFNQNDLSEQDIREIEAPLAEYFLRHTMLELYEMAAADNLLLATCNSPREILASTQLAARAMFGPLGEIDRFPTRFALVTSIDGEVAPLDAKRPAPELGHAARPAWTPRTSSDRPAPGAGMAWAGTRIVEFGSGAAGPIASRYFAEHGATVIRVESRSRPEFLRAMAVAMRSPFGLEGSPIFGALNPGKLSVALDLKNPSGLEVARRLMGWADLVLENFAPKAMPGFGLDYATMSAGKPDLVMISACMNGQTGPHRSYPGFGSQGSALAGFTLLTGYPDRAPVGPFGTITDSLAPRFCATAMAAALLFHRRTGRGLHVDLSQVEAAQYALSPWLLDQAVNGHALECMGNRSPRTAPHGAFPCQGEDRWIALATWSDDEWARLAGIIGLEDSSLATLDARLARVDEVEAAVAAWTASHTREEIAERLQSEGIEAVPVQDWQDLLDDPQLRDRGHFERLEHTKLGQCWYQHNGFRLSDAPARYARPSPMLGEHTEEVLRDILGLSPAEIAELEHSGGVDTAEE